MIPDGLRFDAPEALLLAVPLVLLAAWRRRRPPRRGGLLLADPGAVRAAAAVPRGWRVRTRHLPPLCAAVGVALLLLAAARPQRGLAVTTLPEEGIDIVLALDISGSMQRTVPGSGRTRLGTARVVIAEFLEGLRGDRVGLVAFRAEPFLMSPLTLDHAALAQSVADTATLRALPEGTAVGLGLAESVHLLRDSPARSRVVVLLTDGANNAGAVGPAEAAQVAAALGVRVYTIGFHDGGFGGGGGADRPDARALAAVAEATGGTFALAGTEEALARAYADVRGLERSRVGERRFTTFTELGPPLAAAAVALLVLAQVGAHTAWRRYP